jgi:hypothetical protein
MNKECCSPMSDCINPLIDLYKKAKARLAVATRSSLAQELTTILSNGIVLSNSGTLCCPDCTSKKGYYFLGSYADYKILATLFLQTIPTPPSTTPGVKYPCCLNHSLNVTDAVDYETTFANLEPPCCDSSFAEAVTLLLENSNITVAFPNLSIVEASTFNGASGLRILLDYLILENVTPTEIGSFFTAIFTEGLVIKCFDCDMYIGSVASFGSFAEANSLLN